MMKPSSNPLRRATALFIGYGISNRGALGYLKAIIPHLHTMLLTESAPPEDAAPCFDEIFLGHDIPSRDFDLIVLSPTARRDTPALSRAKERGAILTSDAELFFERMRDDVTAVTGSDGKSTVSYLISKMQNGICAGNFGLSLCSVIDEHRPITAELSSFHLQYMQPKTRRAVITNITKNHLNWHRDYEEYINAKLNVVKNTAGSIYDADSIDARQRLAGTEAFCAVSLSEEYEELRRMCTAKHYLTYEDGFILLDGKATLDIRRTVRDEDYNKRNFMLALGAVLDTEHERNAADVIRNFRGLSHRKEEVLQHGGFTYLNSSIDSTPLRTVNTLLSLSGKRVALILGGESKNLPLDPLCDLLYRSAVGAVLMGRVGEQLREIMDSDERYSRFPHPSATTFEEAIPLTEGILGKDGGIVLLSPAATSFDRYKNFEERGADFVRCLMTLKRDI